MKHPRCPKLVLCAVLPVLRRLPYRLSVALLNGLGRLGVAVVPRRTRLYEEAVAENARRLGCRWDVREVSRSLARQRYHVRTRDTLLDGRTDTEVASLFRVAGREHLDAAVGPGRRVILLTNHFGSHMPMVHWLIRQGYPVRCFGERPRNISRYMSRHFRTDGPLGQAGLFVSRGAGVNRSAAMVLKALRILDAGFLMTIACDIRWQGAKAATATFLGRTESFASTWVDFAALTGAVVVPTYCRIDGQGNYHVVFEAPYHVPNDVLRDGQAADWVQKALSALEGQILLHPESSHDYFFWGSEEGLAA